MSSSSLYSDKLNILPPTVRCVGGNGSSSSDEYRYVSGLEFKTDSISAIKVCNSSHKSFDLDTFFFRHDLALSSTSMCGNPFLLTNLLKHKRKVVMFKSRTISRCRALVVAHMNNTMYTFLKDLSLVLVSRSEAKSMPTAWNA